MEYIEITKDNWEGFKEAAPISDVAVPESWGEVVEV